MKNETMKNERIGKYCEAYNLQKGDVIETSRGKMVVGSVGSTRSKIAIICNYLSDLKQNRTNISYTLKANLHASYMIVDVVGEELVEKVLEIRSNVVEAKAKRATKNLSLKEWSREHNAYVVKMQDGNFAKEGDYVWIRFDNMHSVGRIKSVSGNNEQEVIVIMKGRTKGRGLSPERLLRLSEKQSF